MNDLEHYMRAVTRLRAEIEIFKAQLEVVSEMYDRVHTQRDNFKEALKQISLLGKSDPKAYHTNPEFHAAVFIAKKALDERKEVDSPVNSVTGEEEE